MDYSSIDQTKTERVTAMLRTDIINHLFAPGAHVTIKEISERYHTSNIPVREALRTLESEHFLEINPYKGATILEIDDKYISNIYDIVRALEQITLESVFEIITTDCLEKLREINEEIGRLKDTLKDRKLYLVLNERFHSTLMGVSPNVPALELYARYMNIIQSFRAVYIPEHERILQACQEHVAILDAIAQKDALLLKKCVDSRSNAAEQNFHDQFRNK